MDASEIVTLVAGGMAYTAWESCTLGAALNEACRKFEFATTERLGEFAFPPGTPIQVFSRPAFSANDTAIGFGDLFLRGYVNAYQPKGSAKTHRITIRGRSSSQDWVDCSAVHPTGYAENKSPRDFAQEFNPYGFPLIDRLGLDKVPYQQIMQGETGFDYLERALRPHGATQMGTADGGIDVTNASVAQRAAGALVEGWNIKEYSGELTDGSRHSDYTIKGQGRHGHGSANLRIKQNAKDSGVKRYRPKIIVHEGDCDNKRASDRAKHEKERAAGACIKATIRTQGWRDDGGQIWTPNTIIFVAAPTTLHIVQDMLIESVELEQGEDGTEANLHLVDPRTYRGNGKNGSHTAGAWNAGMGD